MDTRVRFYANLIFSLCIRVHQQIVERQVPVQTLVEVPIDRIVEKVVYVDKIVTKEVPVEIEKVRHLLTLQTAFNLFGMNDVLIMETPSNMEVLDLTTFGPYRLL